MRTPFEACLRGSRDVTSHALYSELGSGPMVMSGCCADGLEHRIMMGSQSRTPSPWDTAVGANLYSTSKPLW